MGNFDRDTKSDEIREYVSSFAEKLISVDEIQLNHKYHKMFKICVEDSNEQAMLNPVNWTEGIRVRRFYFNKDSNIVANPKASGVNPANKSNISTIKESTKCDNLVEMSNN